MCWKFHLKAVILWLLLTNLLTSLEDNKAAEAGLPPAKSNFPSQCSATCPWTNRTDMVQHNQVPEELSNDSSVVNITPQQTINASTVWCKGVDFQEPLLKMKLPRCKNITLTKAEFKITSQGHVLVSGNRWNQEFKEFELSEDNATASVCFLLSPQLLQCGLKRLDRRLYSYSASLKTLQNCRVSSDVISIRDYYTSPNTGDVIGCDVPIGNDRGQRCNYVNLELSEFQVLDDNTSLRLLSSNVVIYWPDITVLNATHVKLCYPMSPEMTTCNLWEFKKHEFSITADHRLFSPSYNQHFELGDFVLTSGGSAYLCKPKSQASFSPDPFFFAMAILQIVSATFVVVAFIIHLLIPSLNYHAKPLLCHMFSTAVMYICASVRRLVFPIPAAGCYTIFVIFYYSSMTSFFWISALAFDLWSIFAGMHANSRLSCAVDCDKGRKFAFYALYAYGVPLLLVAFSVILDTQEPLQEALDLHPGIPMMCWFNERKSALVLCYIPLLIVFLVNIILFVLTVFNLKHASKDVQIVNKKRNKQLLFVCIKIFCIMGLFSIIELVTFMLDAKGTGVYAADISSAIQGIILFIIYICKPATYRVLRKKMCPHSNKGNGDSKSNNRDSNNSGVSMESVLPEDVTPGKKRESLKELTDVPANETQAEAAV